MATRTGISEVDAVLERFASGWWNTYDDTWHSSERTCDEDAIPLTQMKEPSWAWGKCSVVSQSLTQMLLDADIEADTYAGLPEDIGYRDWSDHADRHPEWHGEDPFETHDVVRVSYNGQTLLIDFTAAQYGYDEFPMVQSGSGVHWEREWDQRPSLGEIKAPAPSPAPAPVKVQREPDIWGL